MKIRSLKSGDIEILRALNDQYYPNDAFPDFGKIKPVVVITDDHDRIITAGGVELIAEGVSITDKSFSVHVRGTALRELLQAMLLTCGRIHQDHLHVFVTDDHDDTWVRALKGDGFKKGNRVFFIGV